MFVSRKPAPFIHLVSRELAPARRCVWADPFEHFLGPRHPPLARAGLEPEPELLVEGGAFFAGEGTCLVNQRFVGGEGDVAGLGLESCGENTRKPHQVITRERDTGRCHGVRGVESACPPRARPRDNRT